MRKVETPEAYNVIGRIRQRVPEEARRVLGSYANNKVKEFKLVTKVYTYDFPFHSYDHARLSLQNLIKIIKRDLFKKIPYLESTTVKWGTILRPRTTLYFSPTPKTRRYLRRIQRLVESNNLPVYFHIRDGRHWTGHSYVDGLNIEINVKNVHASLSNGVTGVILLYYLPQIMKFFETAHRLVDHDPNRTTRSRY